MNYLLTLIDGNGMRVTVHATADGGNDRIKEMCIHISPGGVWLYNMRQQANKESSARRHGNRIHFSSFTVCV